MMQAIIRNAKVDEVLDLTETEIQALGRECEAVVDVSTWDPTPPIGSPFIDGKIVVSVTQHKKITRLAFRNRFTQTERATMYAIAAQNTGNGYAFRDYLDSVNTATYIDLSRPDTIASIQMLGALGIITSQRVNEILNNPIQENEKFLG